MQGRNQWEPWKEGGRFTWWCHGGNFLLSSGMPVGAQLGCRPVSKWRNFVVVFVPPSYSQLSCNLKNLEANIKQYQSLLWGLQHPGGLAFQLYLEAESTPSRPKWSHLKSCLQCSFSGNHLAIHLTAFPKDRAKFPFLHLSTLPAFALVIDLGVTNSLALS